MRHIENPAVRATLWYLSILGFLGCGNHLDGRLHRVLNGLWILWWFWIVTCVLSLDHFLWHRLWRLLTAAGVPHGQIAAANAALLWNYVSESHVDVLVPCHTGHTQELSPQIMKVCDHILYVLSYSLSAHGLHLYFGPYIPHALRHLYRAGKSSHVQPYEIE